MPARNPERERELAKVLVGFASTEQAIVRRRKERKLSVTQAASAHADNLMDAITRVFAATRPTRKPKDGAA